MQLADKMKELELAVGEKEERIDQLDRLNKTNENVINWLNKQLTAYKAAEANIGKIAHRIQGTSKRNWPWWSRRRG
jgi:hypothetical protein